MQVELTECAGARGDFSPVTGTAKATLRGKVRHIPHALLLNKSAWGMCSRELWLYNSASVYTVFPQNLAAP